MALANICNVAFSSTVCMVLNADLVTNKKRSRASRRVMTLLIIVMFILSSVDYGSFWAYVRKAFIERGETDQSTADSLEEYPNWFIGLTTAPDVNAVIADGIMVRFSLWAPVLASLIDLDMALLDHMGSDVANYLATYIMHHDDHR